MNDSDLKAGDKAIINRYGSGRTVVTVARVTATQVVISLTNGVGVKYERRFRRESGRECGDASSFRVAYLTAATPEVLAEIEDRNIRAEALAFMRHVRAVNIPTSTLARIAAELAEAGGIEGEQT